LAAYDAAPDHESQKLAIGEGFVSKLCALGEPDSVRAAFARYREAGATEIILTAVWGTDFEPALEAAAPEKQ
jgi:alkanesulfonate monooxygenase SsuD/methylene tetrahydromethanopterin reductase-like flavin-dependent oxidoreductase (luciferase family)